MIIDWAGIHKAAPNSHWVTIDRYGAIMAHSNLPKYADVSGTWSSGLFPSPVKLGMSSVGSDFQASNAIFIEPGFEPKPVEPVVAEPVAPQVKPVDELDEFVKAQNMIASRCGDQAPGDRLMSIALQLSQEAQAKAATVQPTTQFRVDPTVSPQQQFATSVIQFCELVAQAGQFGAKQAEVQQQLGNMKALLTKL